MRASVIAVFALTGCVTATVQAPSACPPAGYDRDRLNELKRNDWAIADDGARNAFARAVTACLGAPDPTLRDGIAYEALFHLLRERQVSNETLLALADDLEARLVAADPQGFERPFAALALSEVARADRIEPFLTGARRQRLVEAAVSYLSNIRDYRGFDPRQGYRHAVAHAADLMAQLVLNPQIGKPELTRIRDAIGSQVAPNEVFYVTGEGERLARPILLLAQRGVFTETEWSQWLAEVAGPGPLGASWDGWFLSNAGLSRRHDVMLFLSVIYMNVRIGENPALAALAPGVEAAIRAMP